MKILVLKESRAGEARVALVPSDAALLIAQGCSVFVESGAGAAAGFPDQAYIDVGVSIRCGCDPAQEDETIYRQLFADMDLLLRAKRPSRQREKMEAQAMASGMVMLGALDPFELNSPHIAEYHAAGLQAYSIDQLQLPADHPMNILAQMSAIAGRLALRDAVEQCVLPIKKVVIIGFGTVGQAALREARKNGLNAVVVLGDEHKSALVHEQQATVALVDRALPLIKQQQVIADVLQDAEIVISSARRANEPAPLLISEATLAIMQPSSVIIDMAISEGGNVAGSKHDATLTLGSGVVVSNISGYPKAVPHEASILWSEASRLFCLMLMQQQPISISPL